MRTKRDPNKITIDNGYAYIELYDVNCNVRAIAKIDKEYVKEVSQHKWRFSNGYAISHTGGRLQHIIYGKPPEGYEIDHRNGDKLDNTELNLRKATKSQNQFNTSVRSNNTSGVTGVWKSRYSWHAQIHYNGQRKQSYQRHIADNSILSRLILPTSV